MDNEKVILALAALAQNTRLDVFRLLVSAEPEGFPPARSLAASRFPTTPCRPT